MAAELVDWRLARYLDTKGLTRAGAAVLKVSHAGGRPILFLNRDKNPPLPQERDIEVEADGRAYRMDFVTVAINVAHLAEEPGNALPDLLWNWFGPDAGQPGTDHRVTVEIDADGRWHMRPNHRDPADRAEFPA